jgi:hypothetical protein
MAGRYLGENRQVVAVEEQASLGGRHCVRQWPLVIRTCFVSEGTQVVA